MPRKPKSARSVSGNSEGALRERIALLVQEHSLSGLAQRTGTPVSSLHRYVNGGRVPATFCAALAENFQVNPAWLLGGRGSRYVTDVGGDAAAMASGMREIVDAMNAASRLKLGTLARRRDLTLLRELADSSDRQQQLRGRLTREVEPVIREWLKALQDAVARFDYSRAADLEEALTRLLRFSDDSGLLREFDRLRSHVAYITGRRTEAVALQRRNLMLLLADGNALGDDELRECFRLCVALTGLGRYEESKAVAEATLALRRGGPMTARVQQVRCMLAAAELVLGNVARAVSTIDELHPIRTAESAPNLEVMRAIIMLRVNAFSVETVLREVPLGLPQVIELVRVVLWREDPAQIRTVLHAIGQTDPRWLEAAGRYAAQAEWVMRVLSGRSRELPKDIKAHDDALAGGGVLEQLDFAVLMAQRVRLSGARNASSAALHAQRTLDGLPADVRPDAVTMGIQARNVLALKRSPLNEAADSMRARVSQLLHSGFGMFREFAAEHGIV
jgi:hypothetical protein